MFIFAPIWVAAPSTTSHLNVANPHFITTGNISWPMLGWSKVTVQVKMGYVAYLLYCSHPFDLLKQSTVGVIIWHSSFDLSASEYELLIDYACYVLSVCHLVLCPIGHGIN